MTPDQRRVRRISIAASNPAGRELLAVQGLLPEPLSTKPRTGSSDARLIAARLDACWPTGGAR